MICAIIPAAGQSRRMGSPKMLLPYGGTTVLEHIIDQLGKSVVDQIIVVTTSPDSPVARVLEGRPVTLAFNPDPESDMLTSIRRGIDALPPGCEAILVVPGDQPGVRAEWVDAMARKFRHRPERIVVPCFQGQRGHPVLFSAEYSQEALSRYDDEGLRGLLRAHSDDILTLDFSDPDVLMDLDTPEDYRQAIERFRE